MHSDYAHKRPILLWTGCLWEHIENMENTDEMTERPSTCDRIGKEVKIRYSPFRLFPILVWIRQYELSFILRDVIAGLTIGLMVTPQSKVRNNVTTGWFKKKEIPVVLALTHICPLESFHVTTFFELEKRVWHMAIWQVFLRSLDCTLPSLAL